MNQKIISCILLILFLFISDSQIFGKSKFYDSSENITGKTLKDIFFELECAIENKQMCRDVFCDDTDKEYGKNLSKLE